MLSFARKACFVLVAGFVAFPPVAREERAEAGPRPNVLIIMTDDQRTDTMAGMRRTRYWFGATGTEFPNAFVSTPLCCPSRASIMTGRYVHNHEVHNNSEAALLDQSRTLQRYLKDAGYQTGISGKLLNAWDLHTDPLYFDRFAIFNGGYRRRPYNVNGDYRKVKQYSTDYVRDQALRFLRFFERADDSPWLLYVHPVAPHDPYKPAKRHRKAPVPAWQPSPAVGEADRTDKPTFVQNRILTQSEAAWIRTRQIRTLLAVDELVKKIMRELGKLGERDNTLAFYTSDNGFFWAEHGLIDKRFPYTEAIHVPLFMRWPGAVPAGVQDPRFAMNIDLFPTIMEATGAVGNPDDPVDGRSLLQPWDRDHILVEHYVDPLDAAIPVWASIRAPSYQYVEYYDEVTEAVTFSEYYDLIDDPWQLENLLADDDKSDPPPAEIVHLSLQLENDRRCQGSAGPEACP